MYFAGAIPINIILTKFVWINYKKFPCRNEKENNFILSPISVLFERNTQNLMYVVDLPPVVPYRNLLYLINYVIWPNFVKSHGQIILLRTVWNMNLWVECLLKTKLLKILKINCTLNSFHTPFFKIDYLNGRQSLPLRPINLYKRICCFSNLLFTENF